MSEKSHNTKARIIETAKTLFSAHGFENTAIDDILNSIGITKGAFYYYFKSKQALCNAVLDGLLDDYSQLVKSIEPQPSAIEQLKQLVYKLAEMNASGKWVNCRLIIRFSTEHLTNAQIERKITDFWRWYTEIFEHLIKKCCDEGDISENISPKGRAQMLVSAMAGFTAVGKNIAVNSDPVDFAQNLMAIICR